ncbi:MAG: BamA/TamA family outer membrane protein, partial [Bacteroidota bacterium]
EKDCQQKAIGDLFRKKEKAPKPPKKFMALVLPNVSSNPSNGFLLGVGGTFGWYMGPKENTRVSSAPFTVAVTSKKQLITFVKSNIYTKENKFFLQGDWRFYIYSQPTYGLGTNAPETGNLPSEFHWEGEGGSTDSLSFPMKFNYVKFSEIVNMKIMENFYAGIGYHFDDYYSIKDEKLNLDTLPQLWTPHYVYSVSNNYGIDGYMNSGLSANVVYDSRDNQANPYKGIYANINYRYNFTFLGSTHDASELWMEFRTYVGLSKKKPRNLIAFWAFGDFNLTGNLPYMTLPSIGGDQRARSGRGYTNGRYRGKNLVYGEVEWRFPIWPCSNIIGGVIFVNATTTDNPVDNSARKVALFQYVQPAVGFGIRVMVNKYFRTNINLDFAIGHQSQGFYFSGQETF